LTLRKPKPRMPRVFHVFMRTLRPLPLVLSAFFACTGTDGRGPDLGATNQARTLPAATLTPAQRAARAQIEKDLALVLTRRGAGPVEPDSEWGLEPVLVNRGSNTHWVVRSNDGSEAGWREPHVFYTVDLETSPGVWQPVERARVGRCGLYATDWYADAAPLAAGERMSLEWFDDPSRMFVYPRGGLVRVVAHYEYDGGAKGSFGRGANAVKDQMPAGLADVPAFALASEPIELRLKIDASVQVTLTLRRASIRAGERVSFASLVDVAVANVSSAPIVLAADPFDEKPFVVESDGDQDWEALPRMLAGPKQLGPNEQAAVRAPADDDVALRKVPGRVRLRVQYEGTYPRADGSIGVRRATTPWVDLDVVP
jgi:hypothetical protein